MNKLLVILGPTATGKTDLALTLAKKFNGELVACDSRQVYQGLDIGTGKMPGEVEGEEWKIKKNAGFWEINGVKIWLYDLVSLNKQYTVASYIKDAQKVIQDIHQRGKLPIVVGGTGLYLKALLDGIPNLTIPVDLKLRKQLAGLSKDQLQQKLINLSSKRWEKMNLSDRENPRRLLRAIELISMYGYIDKDLKSKPQHQRYDTLKIGLTAPREVLYKKVDLRVFDWINQGIIAEVDKLTDQGVSLDRFRDLGLEYRVIADYLDHEQKFFLNYSGSANKIEDQDQMVQIIQNQIHGYVRRQRTWFKKNQNIQWCERSEQAVKLVEHFLSNNLIQ